ncbi:MAG: ATPase, partial [Pseudomonadota bacterium]
LARRFDRQPKPMYYQPAFLEQAFSDYLKDNNVKECDVHPDDFIRATFDRALAHRRPLYAAMAQNWGVSVTASEVEGVHSAEDFDDLIASALDRATMAGGVSVGA